MLETTAIGIGLAAVGNFADVVVADHARNGALVVALADQGWGATTGVTFPACRTFVGGGAHERHTLTQVAAFAGGAIGVDGAGGTGLTEKAVADGAGRALGVGGALSEVDTAVTDALKSGRALSV